MLRKWYKCEFSCVGQTSVSKSVCQRRNGVRVPQITFLLFASLVFSSSVFGQSPNGTISGSVFDPSGEVIAGAEITVENDATRVEYLGKTNNDGIYVVSNLPPGSYRLQVAKIGFKTLIKPDIVLSVQDAVAINFTLPVGAASEIVTVQGGAPLLDTESPAVSTVVDRQFAENLPMNGRSFQTLIQLTPGVVIVPSNQNDSGQFSVNGQRANSNYWMVDGVSANLGVSPFGTPGNGVAGTVGSFSALGGTNSLVSVDALQEFRIQTSSYAPEFGRTPGAQISILTRSGTNQFHGSAFEYLRNDTLDASNWFNNSVSPPLPKAKERQNDFGGTLSGPILKERTFFFFSYEGLRLRLPQTSLTTVPDTNPADPNARQHAVAAVRPYLNAFPLPNGPEVLDVNGNPTGAAQFNKSYSNPATLDAYSLRVDHKLNSKMTLFGRYNYSPSEADERGANGSAALNNTLRSRITVQTVTVGDTWAINPTWANDLRLNYSRTDALSSNFIDNFGGAVPLASLPIPRPFNLSNAAFAYNIFPLTQGFWDIGANSRLLQRQFNLVNSLSAQKASHNLKFGVDYRRLSPLFAPQLYSQDVSFLDVPSANAGNLNGLGSVGTDRNATFLVQNLAIFGQDTWRVANRVTLTYGLRWDVDFAPSSLNGPSLPAVRGFDLRNLANLALGPAGTPPFDTKYGNVAPRVGVAYQVSQRQDWGTVLRGGFGIFYDLADGELGNFLANRAYPFGASNFNLGNTFPLPAAAASPPPITLAGLTSETLSAFDPNLKLPYALEWNAAIEQAFGGQQTLSASYIGSAGRRLIQTAFTISPNANFGSVNLATNAATSGYDALQIQFQRRLSHGLEALASYTWSHSIDTASAGSAFGNGANALVSGLTGNGNRGSSDFDIRHALCAGATYDIPAPRLNTFTKAILSGWSLQTVIQARSAPPVNVYEATFFQLRDFFTQIRPNVVPGVPLYSYGSQYPSGKAINSTANQGGPGCVGPFCPPPTDQNGNPLRQGDLGRNALRGFGATQWDLAVHRDFPIHERLKLQFRAEMFNVLNHPNFGQPQPAIGRGSFGRSTEMLAQYLSGGNLGGGAFDPLYQIGGPRSIQFALKLAF